jgi:hypothetical protein
MINLSASVREKILSCFILPITDDTGSITLQAKLFLISMGLIPSAVAMKKCYTLKQANKCTKPEDFREKLKHDIDKSNKGDNSEKLAINHMIKKNFGADYLYNPIYNISGEEIKDGKINDKKVIQLNPNHRYYNELLNIFDRKENVNFDNDNLKKINEFCEKKYHIIKTNFKEISIILPEFDNSFFLNKRIMHL